MRPALIIVVIGIAWLVFNQLDLLHELFLVDECAADGGTTDPDTGECIDDAEPENND